MVGGGGVCVCMYVCACVFGGQCDQNGEGGGGQAAPPLKVLGGAKVEQCPALAPCLPPPPKQTLILPVPLDVDTVRRGL